MHELLSAARNIAKLLTKVRRALDSASDSLVCERINPLYTETIHQNICNEYASASAWGTITFGTIGLALMVLISLRASWRLNIAEEKIYHDESEVAENMIVDEHEEYLRYISRYKHEWQEYNGFDNESIRNSRSVSASEEDPEELHSVSEAMSETTGYTTAQQGEERFTTDEEELTSIASGDISFPSLAVPPTEDSGDGQIVPMPPPLLSPTRNVAKADEDQNQEVMLYDQTTMNAPGNHYLRPAPVTATAVGKNKRSPKVPPPIDTSVPTEQVAAGNAKLAPADSEESTDFSSIGRNAGGGIVSPTSLYWKHQVGLGIEVAMSSVSDSLVVSPNSESGLTSFDLTKTPSPKKGGAPFYEGEKRAMPSSLELPNIPNKALAGGRADRTQPSIPTTPPLVRPRLNKPASVNNKQSPGSVTRSEGSPASTKKLIRAGSAPASFKEDHSKESPSRLRRSGSSSKISEQKQSNVASPALKRLRSASISSGEKKDGSAVKFEDDNTQQSYIEQQVSHFLKTGKSATPKTPPRQSRKKLSELMRKFDTPPSPSTEHEI